MAAKLAEGTKAPAFKLPTGDGDPVTLADFKGKNLVLFFYPKADTPGCTKEAIAFSALKPAFTKANTAVVGVSADPVKAQSAFKRSTASRPIWRQTRRTQCSKPTGYGVKNPCTAGPFRGSPVQPF